MGLSFAEIFVKKKRCEGRWSWPTALTFWLLFSPFAHAEAITSLEDIPFWVGSGANRAAVVIDWDDTDATDESLVWGYRWDGTATGEDMLLTVLESDTRLFAKLGFPGTLGTSLFGLGYDLDDDSTFDISDGTVFDSDGIAFIAGVLNDSVVPAATATDPEDLYAEGFFTGFWHYGLSSGNPYDGGSWASSGTGLSGRTLADGDWDSLAFTPTFDFMAFAENPHAAEAPLVADFDSDRDIDGADFLAWQRGFGIEENAALEQGDANDDGMVNEDDFYLWQMNFGTSTTGGALQNAAFVVPEPSCIAIALWVFFCFVSFGSRLLN